MTRTWPPGIEGQRVEVEDEAGDLWRIECPGEPVEVGSRVVFEALPGARDRRGVLVRVLEAERKSWVCTVRRGSWGRSLIPFAGLELPRLSLSERDAKGAEDGARVVVVPISKTSGAKGGARGRRGQARRSEGLAVRVVEILGAAGEPDADHRAIVWKHRLATEFSRRARLEVEAIEARHSAAEVARRLDLRSLPFITIDPSSARDHDDALFAEPRPASPVTLVEATQEGQGETEAGGRRANEMGWHRRLWVAIADVAHFVAEGGWVDAEARRRGNSFYFPDRAIPMLPERLSSDLCSLVPDVDRLAMVVELRLAKSGAVVDALFHEAIVRSHARLSYEDAAAWLEGERPKDASEPVWADSLSCLAAIAEGLLRQRREAGAIMLELPEIEIALDDTGRPIDARVRERNPAHGLVEEAMLAANRAVAAALDRAGRETIHRVHPPPNPAKLDALGQLLDRLGVPHSVDLEEPGELARVLDRVREMPSEERVHVAMLRSMSQARYAADPGGHFALRFEDYLHFTSPIRRYADLEVHRALKRLLRGDPAGRDSGGTSEKATKRGSSATLAIWLSGRERVAMEAERDADALACCALMTGREGERFEARVTGATEFGLFIRLRAPSVSGLVPMRILEGYWRYDPEDEAIFGGRSGRRIGLGDALEVQLLQIDSDRGRIAFRMVDARRRQEKPLPGDASAAISSDKASQSS